MILDDLRNNPAIKDKIYYQNENGILFNADCMEILKHIPDKAIDLILTDPPYGINYLSHRTDNHDKIKNDGLEDWLGNLPKWLKEFSRIISDLGCCCCCCCGGGKTPVTAIFTLEAIKYLKLIQTLVWRKFIGLGWRYRPAYENIVILARDENNYNFFDETKSCSNVIENINQDIPNAEEHPTQKPVALMEKLLIIHSQKDYLVLEPFAGGGATLVACERLGRKWIGIELEPKYCEIAKQRILAEYNQIKMF